MNKTGPHSTELSRDEGLALDYALGILVEPDLSLALGRIDADAGFALLVSRYRAQLMAGSIDGGVVGHAPTAPRWETWEAILARIAETERP